MKCATVGCKREAETTVRITMGSYEPWQDQVCRPCERYYLEYSGKLEWIASKV
jgi:hypothetical protein